MNSTMRPSFKEKFAKINTYRSYNQCTRPKKCRRGFFFHLHPNSHLIFISITRIHIRAWLSMWWLQTWFCKRLSQNSIFKTKIHIRACDISTTWSDQFWYGNHGICQVVESYMFHKRAFLYVSLRRASFHERCWT